MSTPRTSPTMSMECELDRLRAENTALRERADVRAIVGELRNIDALLDNGCASAGVASLRDLLRRLDESETR